jgi:hypothetical protein
MAITRCKWQCVNLQVIWPYDGSFNESCSVACCLLIAIQRYVTEGRVNFYGKAAAACVLRRKDRGAAACKGVVDRLCFMGNVQQRFNEGYGFFRGMPHIAGARATDDIAMSHLGIKVIFAFCANKDQLMLRTPAPAHAKILLIPDDHGTYTVAAAFREIKEVAPHTPIREDVDQLCPAMHHGGFDECRIATRAQLIVDQRSSSWRISANASAALPRLLPATTAIRRVGDDSINGITIKESPHALLIRCIATKQAMFAKLPEIAGLAA